MELSLLELSSRTQRDVASAPAHAVFPGGARVELGQFEVSQFEISQFEISMGARQRIS